MSSGINKPLRGKKGQALVMAIFFMMMITLYGLILTGAVIGNFKRGLYGQRFDQAGWLAEAGLQKGIWCLGQTATANGQCGGVAGSAYAGQSFSFGGGTVTVSVTGTTARTTVASTSSFMGIQRKKSLVVSNGTTVIFFPSAVRTNGGDLMMSTGAQVTGNVMANGNITCAGGSAGRSPDVTGSATATSSFTIGSCKIGKDGYGHSLTNDIIAGDGYYQTVTSSTITRPHPNSPDTPPTGDPISPAIISQFKAYATAGGTISGNLDASDMTLGSIRISGDMTIKNNKTLTLTGTLYVQGDVMMGKKSSIALSSSFGDASGVLIIDGRLTMDSNSTITSLGSAKSHVAVIVLSPSTVTATPAVYLTTISDNSVFYAPNGLVRVDNNAGLKAVAAYAVSLEASSTVNYTDTIQSLYLVDNPSSPSGGWYVVPGFRSE